MARSVASASRKKSAKDEEKNPSQEAANNVPAEEQKANPSANGIEVEPKPEDAPSGDAAAPAEAKSESAVAAATKEKKPLKKTVPKWADVSVNRGSGDGKSATAAPASQTTAEAVVEAVKACADPKGRASAISISKFLASRHPQWPKMTLRRAVLKAIEKNIIIQIKGKGLSGSFKVGKPAPAKKTEAKSKGKGGKSSSKPTGPLDDLLPNIFTWICEPKQASGAYIKKYLARHYPNLDVESKAFAKALDEGVDRKQLERITGKSGVSGTFQLVDKATKTGSRYEGAIEDAIIAMNEPKDASIPGLRNYLSEYHTEYDIDNKPRVLARALERCEERGWIKRVTGKGFSGSFRLVFPYHPGPKELWGEWYEEPNKPKQQKRKAAPVSVDTGAGSGGSEVEEEVIPTKKGRGRPALKKTMILPQSHQKKKATPKKKVAAKAPKGKKLKSESSAPAMIFAKKSKAVKIQKRGKKTTKK